MTIEEAYERHAETVYRFFYIKCFDVATAEDLTSQTFMVLVERSHDGADAIGDTKKFVYGVMRNVWLMHLRRKYRHDERPVEDIEALEDFGSYVEQEVDGYEAMTVKQRAEPYIRRLPERQQEIVAMRLLEECSIKDICQRLGKDSNYVKTTFKRGLRRLREIIKQDGQTVTEAVRPQEVL